MRQDETDVNFVDLPPADSDANRRRLDDELSANRRAWDKLQALIAHAERRYPEDSELRDGLRVLRHYLSGRV